MKKRLFTLLLGIMLLITNETIVAAQMERDSLIAVSSKKTESVMCAMAVEKESEWTFRKDTALAVGQKRKLIFSEAYIDEDVEAYSVEWESGNPEVASVKGDVVKALKRGKTKISAVCTYTYYEEQWVEVTPDPEPTPEPTPGLELTLEPTPDPELTPESSEGDNGVEEETGDDYNSEDEPTITQPEVPQYVLQEVLVEKTKTITKTLYVTDPSLKKSSFEVNCHSLQKWDGYYETNCVAVLKGLSDISKISYEKSKGLRVSRYGNLFYLKPKKAGTYTITFTVDGKKLKPCVLKAYDIYFMRNPKTACDENSKKMDCWCFNG